MAQLVRPALTMLTRDTVDLGERALRLPLHQLATAN
jgi:DNA-binding LacI/PurR family transcriptional regulator